jgi:hypothetical protein
VEEESLRVSSTYASKSAVVSKVKLNYNIFYVKDLYTKTELELREVLVELDKLNYSTEI